MKSLTLKNNEILVLRTVYNDMTSYRGFKWPESGHVEAPDWEDTWECGYGLHGLPWGKGNVGYFYDSKNIKWLVVKVDTTKGFKYGYGEITNKCKFKCCEVVFCGNKKDAKKFMNKHFFHKLKFCLKIFFLYPLKNV